MAGMARRGTAAGGGDRVRTHMMFSEKSQDKTSNRRRKRGKSNKLHAKVHQNDVMIQTGEAGEEVDPSEWTGNQRVVHFGPMGNRDPFFYYYPKGWDILYPAAFGFFPYRTKTFRGSTPTLCCTAFGLFFLLGGLGMTWGAWAAWAEGSGGGWAELGEGEPLAALAGLAPLRVAGPLLLGLGLLCLLTGLCWWGSGLKLLSERLRHRQPHHRPPKRTIHHRPLPEVVPQESPRTPNPYVPPPPPAFTVLPNPHTEQFLYSPESEMKLYPPVMPGYSTLSLAHSSAYLGSPYNTLGSRAASLPQPPAAPHLPAHLRGHAQHYHAASLHHKHFGNE